MRTIAIAAAILGSAVLLAQESGPSPVTWQDLLQGYKNPTRWVTYSGDSQRPAAQPAEADHAGRTPIASRRSGRSRPASCPRRGFEGTPLVVDGVVYVTGAVQQRVGARRAHRAGRSGATGASCRTTSPTARSAPVNRGFGILGDTLFMLTARRAPRRARHAEPAPCSGTR